MRVYVAIHAVPWENYHLTIDGIPDKRISGKSDDRTAGFLPIFWTKEAAEEAFPGATISEADVSEDWHPRFAPVHGTVSSGDSADGITLE